MTRMFLIGLFGLLCLAVLVLALMSISGITIGDLRQFNESPASFTNSRPLNAIYELRGDLTLVALFLVPSAIGGAIMFFLSSKGE